MSYPEVHNVPIQPSRSAPAQKREASHDTDSAMTSVKQASISLEGIKDRCDEGKQTTSQHDVHVSDASVAIVDSTCTCSTPTMQTCPPVESDCDCKRTISNDDIRRKIPGRVFLFDYQGLCKYIRCILFGFLLFMYTFAIIIFPVEAPILTIAFLLVVVAYALHIEYVSSKQSDMIQYDFRNDKTLCSSNDRDGIPTNYSALSANNDTGTPLRTGSLDLGYFLYYSFAHSHVTRSTVTIILFVSFAFVNVFGQIIHSYGSHMYSLNDPQYWIIYAVCGFLLLLRSLLYTQMYPNMDGNSGHLLVCPCYQCNFGAFSFYIIPGIVFTVVGISFRETIVMFICGIVMVWLAFIFHYPGFHNSQEPEVSTVFIYKVTLLFICGLAAAMNIIMDSFSLIFMLIVVSLNVMYGLCTIDQRPSN